MYLTSAYDSLHAASMVTFVQLKTVAVSLDVCEASQKLVCSTGCRDLSMVDTLLLMSLDNIMLVA